MIKLRDHYFISWLKVVKNKEIIIDNKLSSILVDITSNELSTYLKEYNNTLKPILKEIRKNVKELNNK